MSNRPTKELLKEWDLKLKASGFVDLEGSLTNTSTACFSDGRVSTARRLEYYQDSEEYFRVAGLFLHHYAFSSPRDKWVWRLHSEGLATRAISSETKVYIKTVQKIIRDLKKEMVSFEVKEEQQ